MLGLPSRHTSAFALVPMAAVLPSMAQDRFAAYDRISVWRVYPITRSFDFDGTENHILEFGATGFKSSSGPQTVSNRHEGRYGIYDFPDIQANLRGPAAGNISWVGSGRGDTWATTSPSCSPDSIPRIGTAMDKASGGNSG